MRKKIIARSKQIFLEKLRYELEMIDKIKISIITLIIKMYIVESCGKYLFTRCWKVCHRNVNVQGHPELQRRYYVKRRNKKDG